MSVGWYAVLLLSLAAVGAVAQCSFQVGDLCFDLTAISTPDHCIANKPSTSYDLIMNACVPIGTQFSPPTVCTSGSAVACHKANNPSTTDDQIIAKVIDTATSTYDETLKTLTLYQTGGDLCPNAGVYRQTKITFTCDETATGATSPVYVTESPTCTYQFTWRTASACPVDCSSIPDTEGGGLSGGSIFLIIFFCLLVVYLAAGMAYKYKKEEARGVEMVPNIDFWRALPQLVKDGIMFTGAKCQSLFNRNN